MRIRAVQKRLVTLQDRKLEILKNYLASLNLNWSASQRFHSTNQIGKHSQACKSNRGFCVMQARLIELKMPECLTCVALLHSVEFDMEKLEKLMKECENPDGEFPSPFTRMKRKANSLQSDGQSHCEPAAIVDDVKMNPDMNPAQNCTNAGARSRPWVLYNLPPVFGNFSYLGSGYFTTWMMHFIQTLLCNAAAAIISRGNV